MHKSRSGKLIIDCNSENLEATTTFWTRALGYEAISSKDPDDENYVQLKTGPDDLAIGIQKVTRHSRVHIDIDIETDNIEAEVARLESIGARRVEKISRWWVMEAPTGHRFCVIGITAIPLTFGEISWKSYKCRLHGCTEPWET